MFLVTYCENEVNSFLYKLYKKKFLYFEKLKILVKTSFALSNILKLCMLPSLLQKDCVIFLISQNILIDEIIMIIFLISFQNQT